MEFLEKIKSLSEKAKKVVGVLSTEAATRNSLIEPFIQLLGYDTSDPFEVQTEYDLGFGASKGIKIDYAILRADAPVIFVEAKWCGEALKDKHANQLNTYFNNSPSAKFGVLTNGIIYRFYTDLEHSGIMDAVPFLEFDLLNPRSELVSEVKKFEKCSFNADKICGSATKLKYVNQFKRYFSEMLNAPSDEFVKFFMGASGVYTGVKNQNAIEKCRPMLAQALNDYVSELTKEKLNIAIDTPVNHSADLALGRKIITTDEELQSHGIIQGLLKEIVPAGDVAYKDCQTYFAILYKGITTKWICRLKLDGDKKFLVLPNGGNGEHIAIDSIYDLKNHRNAIVEALQKYM